MRRRSPQSAKINDARRPAGRARFTPRLELMEDRLAPAVLPATLLDVPIGEQQIQQVLDTVAVSVLAQPDPTMPADVPYTLMAFAEGSLPSFIPSTIGATINVDVDRDASTGVPGGDDVEVQLSADLLTGSLTLEVAVLGLQLSPAQGVTIVAVIPLEALGGGIDLPGNPYVWFGFQTTLEGGAVGGFLPAGEELTITPGGPVGAANQFAFSASSTGANNPLRFFQGTFDAGSSILASAAVAVQVETAGGSVPDTLAFTIDAATTGAPGAVSQSVDLDWEASETALTTFDIVRDDLFDASKRPDASTNVRFDVMPVEEQFHVGLDAATGLLTVVHHGQAEVDALHFTSREASGLLIAGVAQDVPLDVDLQLGLPLTGNAALALDVSPGATDFDLHVTATQTGGFGGTGALLGAPLGYVALTLEDAPDLQAGWDAADTSFAVQAINPGEVIGLFELIADDDGRFVRVIDGRIDMNGDGMISVADNGVVDGLGILHGRVDMNDDGVISAADVGLLQGINVSAGRLDVNGDNLIDAADDHAALIAGRDLPTSYQEGRDNPGEVHHLFGLTENAGLGTAVVRVVNAISASFDVTPATVSQAFNLTTTEAAPLQGRLNLGANSLIMPTDPGLTALVTCDIDDIPAGTTTFESGGPFGLLVEVTPDGQPPQGISMLHVFGRIDTLDFAVEGTDLPAFLSFDLDPDSGMTLVAEDGQGNPDDIRTLSVTGRDINGIPTTLFPTSTTLFGQRIKSVAAEITFAPSLGAAWSVGDTTTVTFDTDAAGAYLGSAQFGVSTSPLPIALTPPGPAADHYAYFVDGGPGNAKSIGAGVFDVDSFSYTHQGEDFDIQWQAGSARSFELDLDSNFGGLYFGGNRTDVHLEVHEVPGQYDLHVNVGDNPSIVSQADARIDDLELNFSRDSTNTPPIPGTPSGFPDDALRLDVIAHDLPPLLVFEINPATNLHVEAGGSPIVANNEVEYIIANLRSPLGLAAPLTMLKAPLRQVKATLQNMPTFDTTWSLDAADTEIVFDTAEEHRVLGGAQVGLGTNPLAAPYPLVFENPSLPVAHYFNFLDEGPDALKQLDAGVFGIDRVEIAIGSSFELHFAADTARRLSGVVDRRFDGAFFPAAANFDYALELVINSVPGQFDFQTNLATNMVYEASAEIGAITLTGVVDDSNDDNAANATALDFELLGLPHELSLYLHPAGVQVINGQLDLTGNGVINGDDAGVFGGVAIVGGSADIDGDGVISASDDGHLLGMPVIDGSVDLDADGVIDSGFLAGGALTMSGPLDHLGIALTSTDPGVVIIGGRVDINRDGVINANDDGKLGGRKIIDGKVDIDKNKSINGNDNGTWLNLTVKKGKVDLSGDNKTTFADTGVYTTQGMLGTNYRRASFSIDDVPARLALGISGDRAVVETRNVLGNLQPANTLDIQLAGIGRPDSIKREPFTANGPVNTGPILDGSDGSRINYSPFLQEIDRRYFQASGAASVFERLREVYAGSEELQAGQDGFIMRQGALTEYYGARFTGFTHASVVRTATGAEMTLRAPTPGLHPFFVGMQSGAEFTTLSIANVPDEIVVGIDIAGTIGKTVVPKEITLDATDDLDASLGAIDLYIGPYQPGVGLFAKDTERATRLVVNFDPAHIGTEYIHAGWGFGVQNGGVFFDSSERIEGLFLTQDGGQRTLVGAAMQDIHAGYDVDILSLEGSDRIFGVPTAFELLELTLGMDNFADGLTADNIDDEGFGEIVGINDPERNISGFFAQYKAVNKPSKLSGGAAVPQPAGREFVPSFSLLARDLTEASVSVGLEFDPLPDIKAINLLKLRRTIKQVLDLIKDAASPSVFEALFDIERDFTLDGDFVFDVWSHKNVNAAFDVLPGKKLKFEIGFRNAPDYVNNTPIHILPGLGPTLADVFLNADFNRVKDLVFTFDGWHGFGDHFDPI